MTEWKVYVTFTVPDDVSTAEVIESIDNKLADAIESMQGELTDTEWK